MSEQKKTHEILLFHLGFWAVAGGLLFLSGLTHLSPERALFRNVLIAMLGAMLTGAMLHKALLKAGLFLRLALLVLMAVLAAALTNFSGYLLFEGSLETIDITIIYRGLFNFFLIFFLWGALHHFRMRQVMKSAPGSSSGKGPGLWASRGRDRVFVPYQDIVLIRASGDYAELVTAAETCLLRETLVSLEQRLAAHGFLRVHRSLIVNTGKIERISKADKGSYSLDLKGGPSVKTGRNYRAAVEKALTGPPEG